jgi:hypothetical protein
MDDDERCCGTGTCMINPQGVCWCGQVWDGEKMARPVLAAAAAQVAVATSDPAHKPAA